VLVAGISGFRKPYVRGKNPSADVLYKWAEKGNFVWLVTEDILDENCLQCCRRKNTNCGEIGGRDRDRTCDLMLAKHALSQLSYTPTAATPYFKVFSLFSKTLRRAISDYFPHLCFVINWSFKG
jgi:hypothetical protein